MGPNTSLSQMLWWKTNKVVLLTGDWRDEIPHQDPSQMDDISDWNGGNRRSTSDEVVDKVVDYINNVQPFGSPRQNYR